MTHRPPFVGRVVLRTVVPASHLEYVAGDLFAAEFREVVTDEAGDSRAT